MPRTTSAVRMGSFRGYNRGMKKADLLRQIEAQLTEIPDDAEIAVHISRGSRQLGIDKHQFPVTGYSGETIIHIDWSPAEANRHLLDRLV